MRLLLLLVRFLIPVVVLYTLGYLVAGFSALTVGWILALSVLILGVEWLVERLIGRNPSGFARFIIHFFVAAVVIFTVTLGIQGGHVPLGGSLLAAAVISALTAILAGIRQENPVHKNTNPI